MTARGGSASAGWMRAATQRAARDHFSRDTMMPAWNTNRALLGTHVSLSNALSEVLSACRRPPAAVHPQPLLRVFPDPALDHKGHGLHGPLHVHLPVGIPGQVEGRRELEPEPVARQADHPHPVDRAVEPAGEFAPDRGYQGGPAPENHDHAPGGKV